MHLVCLSRHYLMSNEHKKGENCSWHDFASSILTSGISTLCLYGAIQLCTKHIVGFPASSELSPSPERMEFCGNFLSKWNFAEILFGRLLARIAEYSLNGSQREVKFHKDCTSLSLCEAKICDTNMGSCPTINNWKMILHLASLGYPVTDATTATLVDNDNDACVKWCHNLTTKGNLHIKHPKIATC